VTKSYLLLGDVYLQQKDYFNAKATFQSVMDNTEVMELKEEARTKLQRVVEEERKSTKLDS
jgi:7,8-dihydro-6-hydroxymethylpterin-pyrophosphokinase